MRLYRLENTRTTRIKWVGTQADGASTRALWVKEGEARADINTEEIEVPTKKDELLKFLNDYNV